MTDKAKLEKIKKLADAMYYAAFNLTTDASLLRKAMNEYRQFVIHKYCKEEPVSEDLETEIENYCLKHGYIRKQEMGYTIQEQVTDIATHFYNLGKQQEEPLSEDLKEAAISYAATGEFLDNGKEMIDFQKEKSFIAGAKWDRQRTIDKACEFLKNDLCCYVEAQDFAIDHKRLENDFRKALEE